MRQLYYRVRNKMEKEWRMHCRDGVPFQGNTTFVEKGTNWYDSILAGPSTFVEHCTSSDTLRGVVNILEKLDADSFLRFILDYYRTGLTRFGKSWRYADISTVLYALSTQMTVGRYLEIGVRRGRSMAIVASLCPKASIIGFDLWIPNYVGIANPGPDFVRQELSRVGFCGDVEFVTGNSRRTVPRYFEEHPDAYFDLITVDGDHTVRGARIDLKNVLPRLKIGGAIVFDDICNPEHRYLKRVWDCLVGKSDRYYSYAYEELGYGVGFAIRRY